MGLSSAGDHVKFNFPMAFSVWFLNWGMLEFPEAYEAAGVTNMMCDMIKWPLDYFLKCWHEDSNTLYTQVRTKICNLCFFRAYVCDLRNIVPKWILSLSLCCGPGVIKKFNTPPHIRMTSGRSIMTGNCNFTICRSLYLVTCV